MEKNHKIIIIGLIIVIIALVTGIAYMFMGNSLTGNGGGNVPDGMQMYDFNSVFKMAVPKNAKFLKEWNEVNDFDMGDAYSYLDKDNQFSVLCGYSQLINRGVVNSLVQISNKSGNSTFDFEGDLIISHNVKASGKVGDSQQDCDFKETIILQKGHELIVVSGNDLDLIKSMVNTIEFYE